MTDDWFYQHQGLVHAESLMVGLPLTPMQSYATWS